MECLTDQILVGTTPYTSKFTGRVEQLPAAIGLIAAKGSDIMLAEFVSDLFETEEDKEATRQDQVVLTNNL